MRRFLMQEHKLANEDTASAASGTAVDAATYVDAEGFENICVLSRVVSTTGSPTVKLELLAATAGGGTGATAVASVSWTGGTTADIAALHAPANVKGSNYHYFAVKLTTTSGTAVIRDLYFLGSPRHLPISTHATLTGAQYHIATVKATAVAT